MKHLSLAALFVLAVTVATARADISLQWREVTPDSGTIESEFAADIPAGHRSWQLLVTTDEKWIGSELDVVLEQGSIYYDAFGNKATFGPPNAALFGVFPSARFSSHLSGTKVVPAIPGQRQGPSFAPNPVRPGKDKTYTAKDITTTWFTPDPLLETPGTHVIAMLTLSDDATGRVLASGTDDDRPACFDCPPPGPGGVLFILDSQIVNGEIIPEPSTALLAVLGLLGLVLSTARRRSRRA